MKKIILAICSVLLLAGCSSSRKAEVSTYKVPAEHLKAHQRYIKEQHRYNTINLTSWKENQ